jgi:O-antigen/teichoic acid export membrane protein
MNPLTRNLLANFFGKAWAALMSLAFVPLLIRFMGIEAYGLVGFYTTLMAVLALLDFGLSFTLNREMARYSVHHEKAREMRDTVRTLELIYWVLAVLIGLTVVVISPVVAQRWLRPQAIGTDVVQKAIALIGIVIAFQWPMNFYLGGLLGLQRQVLSNSLNAAWFTLRFAGGALVLWLISPSILTFFLYQALVSAVSAVFSALLLWRALPHAEGRSQFKLSQLSGLWRFSAGMGAISITVIVLNQLDKIILSKSLSLEMFGYYSLAWTLGAGSMAYLANPVFTAVFPRLVQKVADHDVEGLKALYHLSSQLASVLLLPTAVLLVFFAPEILLAWTRNSATVSNTQILVRLLAIGFSVNGLMTMPYVLQLAYGWTRLAFVLNLLAALVLAPAILISVSRFGAIGVAVIWSILNPTMALINLTVTHRRILRGEMGKWLANDVGMPLLATLVTVTVGWLLIRNQSIGPTVVLEMAALLGLSYITAAVAAPRVRQALVSRLPMITSFRSA